MAFLDTLRQGNIFGRAKEWGRTVARKGMEHFPYLTGAGAGLVGMAVPTMAPLAAYGGYGVGRAIQQQAFPQYAAPKTEIGEPYETMSRAAQLAVPFWGAQQLLGQPRMRTYTQPTRPEPLSRTERMVLQSAEGAAREGGATTESALRGLQLRQDQIERMLATRGRTFIPGAERPWHQQALEVARSSNNWQEVKRILDAIPATDLYKATMEEIFRPQVTQHLGR